MDQQTQSTIEPELDETSADTQPKCVTCSSLLEANFCPKCGEQRFDPHHLRLRHFFEHAIEGFTHADNRLFRSLKYLVIRPGFLTNEFMQGRRKSYLQPVQLFLVVNLIFFLIQTFSILGPLTTKLTVHMNLMPYRARATEIVNAEIAKRHLSLEEYATRFDAKEATEAKTLVIVMVPGFALALGVLQARKGAVLIRHLVFAFQFYAFALLFLSALGALATLFVITVIVFHLGHPGVGYQPRVDLALSWFLCAALGTYLYRSLRVAYKRGWVLSLLTTAVLLFIAFEILQIYRHLLFYITIHSV